MKTKIFSTPTPYIATALLVVCYLIFEAMLKSM